MRIGTGYDVHQLVEGRDLIIGGVKIPFERGLLGHSDADVLLHAIADALLGALALGDLGAHFPDHDPQYKNADSQILLKHVFAKIQALGFELGNLDATIIAQRPKMKPYLLAMRENIARCLQCEVSRVSVKATTTEHLGFEGREEGIAVQANVLILRS